MTFPEIYQRKFSCVNDMSVIWLTFSKQPSTQECILSIFCLFSIFFSFSSSFVRRSQSVTFLCMFWLSMFLRTNWYIFDVVIINCMTAGSRFKMAASNSKWLVCDVIMTSWLVRIDASQALPSRAQELKKSPGKIGLKLFPNIYSYNTCG